MMRIPYTKQDRVIQSSWPGIRFKSPTGGSVTSYKKMKHSEQREWKKSMEGWIKANFDGAASISGLSCAGAILQNSDLVVAKSQSHSHKIMIPATKS